VVEAASGAKPDAPNFGGYMSLGGGYITFVGADHRVHIVARDGFEISDDNIVTYFDDAVAKINDATRQKIEFTIKRMTFGSVDVETYFAYSSGYDHTDSHKEAVRIQAAQEKGHKKHEQLPGISSFFTYSDMATTPPVEPASETPKCTGCEHHDTAAEPPPQIQKPRIDVELLFGSLATVVSEMKYIVDHPSEFDEITFETVRSNLQGLNRFQGYMAGKLAKLGFKAE
jgi:hypothetical protein